MHSHPKKSFKMCRTQAKKIESTRDFDVITNDQFHELTVRQADVQYCLSEDFGPVDDSLTGISIFEKEASFIFSAPTFSGFWSVS
jgi:hypothetical protein